MTEKPDMEAVVKSLKAHLQRPVLTHCPRCGRKLDVFTRTEGNVIHHVRDCGPCLAKEHYE